LNDSTPMNDIRTERLVLSPLTTKYLHSTHEYISDPENVRLMLFMHKDTIEETYAYLKQSEDEFKKDHPSFIKMAVLLNGVHIGAVSLYFRDEGKTAELGWVINKRYQRQGYAFEAISALWGFAVRDMGIKHCIARCDTENTASSKLMQLYLSEFLFASNLACSLVLKIL